MSRWQQAGVPAGLCQTAEDRCDHDPQLSALNWLTEVTGTKIGRWPVAEVAVKMSESPAYIGGRLDRGAPCYGEDNHYVYGELLGMSSREIEALAEEGVICTDRENSRLCYHRGYRGIEVPLQISAVQSCVEECAVQQRIGIDVGGTNTDAVLMQGQEVVGWVNTPTPAHGTSGVAT